MIERIRIDATFYLEQVLPQIPDQQRAAFAAKYPDMRFDSGRPLATIPIVMLVALTGTGKTTTLNLLSDAMQIDCTRVPSRRDLANMIIIPTAQVIAGDVVQPVKDRVERFRYTGLFADHIAGGYAEAYAWLYLDDAANRDTLVCEGIRGHHEIAHALRHCPQWHIIELTANPTTRLKRLSQRDDPFDHADGTLDFDFLPETYHEAVQAAMREGRISKQAFKIMAAEAQNYGLVPYGGSHPRYQLIETDHLSPQSVAQNAKEAIIRWRV